MFTRLLCQSHAAPPPPLPLSVTLDWQGCLYTASSEQWTLRAPLSDIYFETLKNFHPCFVIQSSKHFVLNLISPLEMTRCVSILCHDFKNSKYTNITNVRLKLYSNQPSSQLCFSTFPYIINSLCLLFSTNISNFFLHVFLKSNKSLFECLKVSFVDWNSRMIL